MASSPRGWWLAPYWIAQLATGAKSFVDNPILGSSRLNRKGLHRQRLALAHRLGWWRRRQLARQVDEADRGTFDRDGYVRIDNFLPKADFDQLVEELLPTPLPTRSHQQGNAITRRVALDPRTLKQFPALRRLINGQRWRGLMRYAATSGGQPLYYLQTIITDVEGFPDPQITLHSDSFQPSMKAWLFLTDVDDDGGPLTYVAGSHLLTKQRLDWEQNRSITVAKEGDRLSQRGSLRIDQTELASLGLPAPTRFAVAANTLVVVDTFGFHARGQSTKPSLRMEIWAYRRRTPFLPWAGLNLFSIPVLANRRAGLAWAAADWLDRWGWRKQHWTDAGQKQLGER